VRLGRVSRSIAAATDDEGLWKEILLHQFDVCGQFHNQKAMVKKLHMGLSEAWEGVCLDIFQAHWTPYPFSIESAELVTDSAQSLAAWPTSVPCPLARSLRPTAASSPRKDSEFCVPLPRVVGSTVLAARCCWPGLGYDRKVVAGLYPVGAGLGKAWFACKASGRYARWLTLAETEVGQGEEEDRVRARKTYWGFVVGSVFVGLYSGSDGGSGACCLFMKEVMRASSACPILRPVRAPSFGLHPSSRSKPRAFMEQCCRYEGILVWPAAAAPSARSRSRQAVGSPAAEPRQGLEVLRVRVHAMEEGPWGAGAAVCQGRGRRCKVSIAKIGADACAGYAQRERCAPRYGLQDLADTNARRQHRVLDDDWDLWAEANNLRRGEVDLPSTCFVARERRPCHGEQLHLLMQADDTGGGSGVLASSDTDTDTDTDTEMERGANRSAAGTLTLQAIEVLDEQGQRHALGNMFCGVLTPFVINGQPLLPPVTLTLVRRANVLGGVMRDARSSASLALFPSP
jgi:hypothetical protein